MPRNLLEGDTEESRIWRETPNEFWSRELKRDITPRFILQVMGTECMRNGFNHDIWMLIVKNKILQNPNTNWVISDVRFRNEQNMIRSLNGEIWQIRRGELPEWYSAAVLDNNEQSNLMDSYKIHDSEWRWIDHDDQFNQIIKNDQTLDDLKQTIKSIL